VTSVLVSNLNISEVNEVLAGRHEKDSVLLVFDESDRFSDIGIVPDRVGIAVGTTVILLHPRVSHSHKLDGLSVSFDGYGP